MSVKINKNGKEYKFGVIPNGYPASNIELADGTNVQDFADDIRCDKTTAGTYTLRATVDAQGKVTYSWVSA